MGDAVDMLEVVNSLGKRPRARFCVVMTHDYKDQKKWAKQLAVQTEMKHIDLMELFSADDKLSSKISSYSEQELLRLLKEYGETSVLIVSGIEFIKATWAGMNNAIQKFAKSLETWHQKPALLFVMQYDKELANIEFKRYPQHDYIIDQKDTLALV